jgi:hypothetical protein
MVGYLPLLTESQITLSSSCLIYVKILLAFCKALGTLSTTFFFSGISLQDGKDLFFEILELAIRLLGPPP